MLRRTMQLRALCCTAMLLVKKYPNRRLYDTRNSRYMTLEELEKIIRGGEDIMVQDAQDARDLTQEVLTQIILERGQGKILPSSLLLRLIRLDDAALGEFMTRYVSWALDMYMQVKERTTSILPRQIASAPFAAADALARLMLDASPYARFRQQQQPPPVDVQVPFEPPPDPAAVVPMPTPIPPPVQSDPHMSSQVQQLRNELEALRASLTGSMVAKRRTKSTKKKRS
jgi:polyhydroxyalkanoate synthesis repressor PhaR